MVVRGYSYFIYSSRGDRIWKYYRDWHREDGYALENVGGWPAEYFLDGKRCANIDIFKQMLQDRK